MKTNKFFQLLTLAICAIAFAFVTGCEGPAGPIGPDGADGTNGTNGTDGTNGTNGSDGTDGVDANTHCLTCHTQAGMDVITASFKLSEHAIGGASSYAAGSSGCSPCHSAELFANYVLGKKAVNIVDPTPLRCGSCHGNHASLEDGITAPMTTEEPVKSRLDATLVYDLGSVSNICMNCHQSRKNGTEYDKLTEDETVVEKFYKVEDIATYTSAAVGPNGTIVLDETGTTDTLVVTFDVPMTHVYISSTHAGPHYSAQTNTLFGKDGYGASTVHADHSAAGCATCHMGEAGDTEGGHTYNPNLVNCNTAACHDGTATSFDVGGVQTSVEASLAAIETALEAAHAIHTDAEGEVHPMLASVSRDVFQAFWNYMIVTEDQSAGVHNPVYISTLLAEAKTKLGI